MSEWESDQEAAGVPLIERTYRVKKPNGEIVTVNRFDLNLARCVEHLKKTYIQCSDTTWINSANLKIIA